MGLRTALVSIWTEKKDKESFIENELAEMGPGENEEDDKNGK